MVWGLGVLALLTLGLPAPPWGQVGNADGPAGNMLLPGPEQGQENGPTEEELRGTTRTVYFDSDPEVGDRLARALAYQRNRDYRQAFDAYLEILTREDSTLFRLDDNLYVNTRVFCLARIRELPEGFLRSYRLAIDGEAKAQLEKARVDMDEETLRELARKYFASTVGEEILDVLGEACSERGRPAQAAQAWDRLLHWYPETAKDRAMLRVKVAVTALASGNVQLAEVMLEEFSKEHAGRKVVIGGKEVDGETYLRELLGTQGKGAAKDDSDRWRNWRELGGGPERTGIMPATFRSDSWVWSFELPGHELDKTEKTVSVGYSDARHPVVLGGQVVMVGNGMVVGSNGSLNTTGMGAMRPLMPVYEGGRLYINSGTGVACLDTRSGHLCWATPGYAEMSRMTPQSRGNASVPQGYQSCVVRDGVVYATVRTESGIGILALESVSGRMRWVLPAGGDEVYTLLRSAMTASDPLVVGERMFVGVCTQETGELQQGYHLLCINMTDRSLLWKRRICGSGTLTQGYNWLGQSGTRALAFNNGLIYVDTGLGGLAAVEASTGEVQWGYAYERWVPNQYRFRQPQERFVTTVNGGPVVLGTVVCSAPADSRLVYGLDARTGETLWKLPREDQVSLLGGANGTLYLSGTEMWWVDVATGKVNRWTNETLEPMGQGFVTTDAIYVPTERAIYRFERETGKLVGKILLKKEQEEAGNLLLVDGQFLSVSRDEVHVFEVWDEAQAGLRETIRRTPEDPLPYERLGQGLARRQDWLEAIKDYQLSLTRYQQRGATGDQAAVTRVRGVLYGLHEQAADQALTLGRMTQGLELAQRMKEFAADDEKRLQATTRIVRFQEKLGLWEAEVASLEGLLKETPYEIVALGNSMETSAGLYAETEITRLIAEHGRACYARFDREAADLVTTGKAEDYTKVLRVYPNSLKVGEALLGLSRIAASSGRYSEAARHLGRMMREGYLKDDTERANALWLIGNYWERAGQREKAAQHYTTLTRDFPTLRVTVDGTPQNVTDVVKTKLASPEFATMTGARWLPSLSLPLEERWNIKAGGGMPTMMMSFKDGNNGGILVRSSEGRLICVDFRTGQVKWEQPNGPGVLRQVESYGNRVLEWLNNEIVMVDADNGAQLWKFTPTGMVQRMVADDELVVLCVMAPRTGLMTLIALDVERGKPLWTTEFSKRQGMWWTFLEEEQIVVVSQAPAGVTLLDRKGKVKTEMQEPDGGNSRGSAPVLTKDGKLLVFIWQPEKPANQRYSVSCWDLKTRQRIWRQTPPGDQTGFMGLGGDDCVSEAGDLLVILGHQAVTCMRMTDGNMVWQKRITTDGSNRKVVVSGDGCYVLTNTSQRKALLTKFGLKDGEQLWQTGMQDDSVGDTLWLSKDHVMVSLGILQVIKEGNRTRTQSLGGRVSILDRQKGEEKQVLVMKDASGAVTPGMQPGIALMEGRLWVQTPLMLFGYASKDK